MGIFENFSNERDYPIWAERKAFTKIYWTFQDKEQNWRRSLPSGPSIKTLGIHNVFYVSMLHKYVADPTHIINYDEIRVQPNTTYVEKPVRIIDTKEQVLSRPQTEIWARECGWQTTLNNVRTFT